MDGLVNLLPIIGPEKTLVIDSTNYGLNTYRYLEKNILVYYPQGGIIQADDVIQQEQLQYYFEYEKCRQLIFIGSINRLVIDKILSDDSPESPNAALKFNLSTLLRGKDSAIISLPLSERLLTELNAVMQCKLLMNYDFIRRRIENKELQLRGIVAERKGE
jgi:hypothetical protein